MVLCGIAFCVFAAAFIVCRKFLTEGARRMLLVAVAAAFLGGVYGLTAGRRTDLLSGELLERKAYGEGSYEQELLLKIGDEDGNVQKYSVTVPEQRLTDSEEKVCLLAAEKELEAEFPGENESVNCIRKKVVIRDRYQDGKVEAEWRFDPYRLIDGSGNIMEEELDRKEASDTTEVQGESDVDESEGEDTEGKLVTARVVLSCGDSQMTKEFCFQVYPAILGEEEIFLKQLHGLLEEAGEERGTDVFPLPRAVGTQPVSWRTAADYTPEKILLGGLALAVCVPLLERSRRQEEIKKRARLLEIEYPDMVSRMALMIGAGMTLQGAWRRIASAYEEKRAQGCLEEKPVFEEMLITCREMESGMGEQRAYERFGDRCGLAGYRRFGNILAQNLKKGSRGLVTLLEQEAAAAYEERKNTARKYGEEAGTKLLIPMVMMLGIVMFILLVPAVFTFQI